MALTISITIALILILLAHFPIVYVIGEIFPNRNSTTSINSTKSNGDNVCCSTGISATPITLSPQQFQKSKDIALSDSGVQQWIKSYKK